MVPWLKRNLDLALPYLAIGAGLVLSWLCFRRCTDCGLEAGLCGIPLVIGGGASVLAAVLAVARTYYRHLDFRRLVWLGPLVLVLLAGFLLMESG